MQTKENSWWETAEKDILNGVIRAVRYTIVENNGDYPKAWRVLERVS